jgi:hypothetical protein
VTSQRRNRRALVTLLGAELLLLVLIAGGIVIGHMREPSTATPPSATEFTWALDEGSERILYLEGGTYDGQPTVIQIREAGGAVLVTGDTRVLDPAINAGVCTGTRSHSPIWWSRTIPEAAAAALRRHDYQAYGFWAFVDRTWKPVHLSDTGCRPRGQG